ncbi:hypothetical protein MVEN_00072400 [Mycena venus]|uniref:Uncharacterized protein n=1 Tax=Mycena venus TaxID=2733690 RepID=A0A8H6Z3X6_9AGAR|nr:hypothetical protein MVEN_00072400 [Mycena venus]
MNVSAGFGRWCNYACLYTGKIPGTGVRYSDRPCNDTYLPTYLPTYFLAAIRVTTTARLSQGKPGKDDDFASTFPHADASGLHRACVDARLYPPFKLNADSNPLLSFPIESHLSLIVDSDSSLGSVLLPVLALVENASHPTRAPSFTNSSTLKVHIVRRPEGPITVYLWVPSIDPNPTHQPHPPCVAERSPLFKSTSTSIPVPIPSRTRPAPAPVPVPRRKT